MIRGDRIREAIEFDVSAQLAARVRGPGLCSGAFGPREIGDEEHCLVGAMAIYYLVAAEGKLGGPDPAIESVRPRGSVSVNGDLRSLEAIANSRPFLDFYGLKHKHQVGQLISINDGMGSAVSLGQTRLGDEKFTRLKVSNLARAEIVAALAEVPELLELVMGEQR